MRGVLRSVAVIVAGTLAACAGPPQPPAPIATLGGRPPPVVLRLAEVPMRGEPVPSAAGELAGPLWGGTMLGLMFAIPTLGTSLVLVPMGAVQGASRAGEAAECAARWRAAVGDASHWLARALAPVSPLATMAGEVERLAIAPPPQVAFERDAATAADRTAALRAIARDLSAQDLLVGDVSIAIEPARASRCGVRFVGTVRLRAHRDGLPQASGPGWVVRAAHEAPDARIEAWADDPEPLRESLRRLLRSLAAEVLASYPWR